MRKIVFIGLLFVFIACSSSPVPRGILAPEEMQKVVYDIMQIDEFINSFLYKDSSIDIKKERSIYYEKVFKIHHTNRRDFYASFKYYQQHPDLQKLLLDSLTARVKRKNPEPNKRGAIKFQEKVN